VGVAAKLTPHTRVGVSPPSFSLHPIQTHRLVLHLSFNETEGAPVQLNPGGLELELSSMCSLHWRLAAPETSVKVGAGSTAESTRASVEHDLLGAAWSSLAAAGGIPRVGNQAGREDKPASPHTSPHEGWARRRGDVKQPPLREGESGATLCLGIPSSVC
jgi:hypothetical protein